MKFKARRDSGISWPKPWGKNLPKPPARQRRTLFKPGPEFLMFLHRWALSVASENLEEATGSTPNTFLRIPPHTHKTAAAPAPIKEVFGQSPLGLRHLMSLREPKGSNSRTHLWSISQGWIRGRRWARQRLCSCRLLPSTLPCLLHTVSIWLPLGLSVGLWKFFISISFCPSVSFFITVSFSLCFSVSIFSHLSSPPPIPSPLSFSIHLWFCSWNLKDRCQFQDLINPALGKITVHEVKHVRITIILTKLYRPESESPGFLSWPRPDLLGLLRKRSYIYKMRGLEHIDLEPWFQPWQSRIWKDPDAQIPQLSQCEYFLWASSTICIHGYWLGIPPEIPSRHLCILWLGSCTNPCFFLLLCLNVDEHEWSLTAHEPNHASGRSIHNRWIGGNLSSSLVGRGV